MGEISKKVQESRLKWYGHVLRREDEYVGKRVMRMDVSGKRRRGRPKRRWLDSIRNELSERDLSGVDKTGLYGEASHKTHRPHIKVGEDAEEDVPYAYCIAADTCRCVYTSITTIGFLLYRRHFLGLALGWEIIGQYSVRLLPSLVFGISYLVTLWNI